MNQLDQVKEIAELKTVQRMHTESIRKLSEAIDSLSKSFTEIKWAVYGALGLYVVDKVGIAEFLKGVF